VNAHNGPIWCMRYFEKFFWYIELILI
jgi:hypothetical protein